MRNYLTWFVVLATCVVAFGPLCTGFFGPASYARWMLAQAANEYENEQPDQAEETLAKALSASNEIAGDPEFWILRFKLVFGKEKADALAVSALFDEAIAAIPTLEEDRQTYAARIVAELFRTNKRTDLAVDILQTCFPPLEKRSSVANNELAYFRSLQMKELDVALKEINAAVAADPNVPEFLDTKAWVLHGLNRNEVAIKFVNESISQSYELLKKEFSNPKDGKDFCQLFEPDTTTQSPSVENPPVAPESVDSKVGVEKIEDPLAMIRKRFPLSNRNAVDTLAKKIAVLRFHRACILDDLGRTEESEVDYAWLDRFGFSDTKKLE
jgi:hypothetical protein